MTTVDFGSPLSALPGLGPKAATTIADHLDLHTVRDLLFHLPRRYEQRGNFTDIGKLTPDEQVTVQARVVRARSRPMRQRRGFVLEAQVTDGSGGELTLVFFGKQPLGWLEQKLRPGRWGLFAGKVSDYRAGRRVVTQLAHPQFELLDEPEEGAAEDFASEIIPIYPASRDVTSWDLTKAIRKVLALVAMPGDPLPGDVRTDRKLIGLADALHGIHRPDSWAALAPARRRLTWDEAFAVQLTLVQRRIEARQWPATPRRYRAGGLADRFDAALPYRLTEGQRGVGERLAEELARPHPMHRLLQGEVGSGKTVCALRAALQVVDAGGQAALLAPTEVLAAQHYRNIGALLGPLGRAGELGGDPEGTTVALVTGSQGAAVRRRAVAAAGSGEAGIVVGTHALLYEGVSFQDLGLVIVDEQHRFGVEQRDALRAKAGTPPHVLVMTATPIPRTVAMTVYGDLEVSTLRELPAGRSPVATHVVPATEQPELLARGWQRLVEEVSAGRQGYVVCPRIGGDDGDAPPAGGDGRPPLAVLDVAPMLTGGPLSEVRVGVLHGRLPADEKESVMRAFAEGSLDVVVATTVVEVGVDVPNATMMVVLDADRFGVSQLHQLRGRVGRGTQASLCLLVTEAGAGTDARERLAAVASTLDGFALAELDLAQRREGDVLGAAQSGARKHLRLLSLLRDADLITEARAEAEALLAADPELAGHPGLAEVVATLVADDRAAFLEKT